MADNVQLPDSAIRSLLAPIFQPGAQFGLTQQETATSGQSEKTSAQEQKTSAQSAATSATQNTNLQLQQPGINAQVASDQVKAQKDKASIQIGQDFKTGMTLQDGMKKYNGLVAPDQIFSNYIQAGYYGLPKQSANQLKGMGVDNKVLGQMDQPGDFMNRQNVAAAINEMNQAENMYNSLSDGAKYIPGGDKIGQGKAYEQLRSQIAAHLAGIFPNSPAGEGQATRILNMIPSAGNPTNAGIANEVFANAKGNLLTGNNYQDPSEVGLSAKDIGPQISTQPQQQGSQGKQLLTTLAAKAQAGNNNGGDIRQGLIDVLQGNPKQAIADAVGNNPKAILANVLGAQKDVGVGGFNTALASSVIPGIGSGTIGRLLGGGKIIEGASGATEQLPSYMKSLMRTGAAMGQTGNVRTAMLQDATKQGVKINGNDIVNNFTNWAKDKILGSSDPKDIQAVNNAVDIAKNQFSNKTFTPNELKGVYDKVTKAYTQGGELKAPIQAELDAAKKHVFDKVLGSGVKGWDEATGKFDHLYDLEEAPIKKYAARAVATGAGGLMSLLGLKEYQHLVAP